MTAIMKTVIQNGTGRAANIGKPAAGKTGTTDDCRDAYFIGFTPDIVTGVWVGNDDNSKMGELTGGTIPAKIWREIMLVATEPYGKSDFEYPEIILNPFKASNVSIIPQSEAKKIWEEQDAKQVEELEKEAEKEAKKAEKELKKLQKEVQQQLENSIVKPDTIKPNEILQQTMTPIKKKEVVKTIDVKEEREQNTKIDHFAPIPISAPIGN
jgi:penicillin-binding protein 1A